MSVILALIAAALNIFAFSRFAGVYDGLGHLYREQGKWYRFKADEIEHRLNSENPDVAKKREAEALRREIERLDRLSEDAKVRAQGFKRWAGKIAFILANGAVLGGLLVIALIAALFLPELAEQYKIWRESEDFLPQALLGTIGSGIVFLVFVPFSLIIRRCLGITGSDIKAIPFTFWVMVYASIAFGIVWGLLYSLHGHGVLTIGETQLFTLFLGMSVYFGYYPSFAFLLLIINSEERKLYSPKELAISFLARRPPMLKDSPEASEFRGA